MTIQEPIPGFRADLQAIIKKYPELECLMLAGVIYLGLDEDETVALRLAVQAPPECTVESAILRMQEGDYLDSQDGLTKPMESPDLEHNRNDTDSPDHDYPHSVQVFIDRERARMHQEYR